MEEPTDPEAHDRFSDLIDRAIFHLDSSTTRSGPRRSRPSSWMNLLGPLPPDVARASSRRTSRARSILSLAAAEFTPSSSRTARRMASTSAQCKASASTDAFSKTPEGPLIKFTDLFDLSAPRSTHKRSFERGSRPSEVIDSILNGYDSTEDEDFEDDFDDNHTMAIVPVGPTETSYADSPSSFAVTLRNIPTAVLLFQADTHISPLETHATSLGFRYLPLRPTLCSRDRVCPISFAIAPSTRREIDRVKERTIIVNATWPKHQLPLELFDIITSHLSREDVKSLRLVCKEFECKVSRSLFHTSVVPFNTELYDMIDDGAKKIGPRESESGAKSRGKMKATDIMQAIDESSHATVNEFVPLNWQNAKDDKDGKVYKGHGLRVFQGFGPHIRRFGMSFEVSEDQLSQVPSKASLDHVDSYFGSYDWPPLQYARYANLAGLERIADETSRMKAAFANLESVRELGLSIDSGLGWLSGPDRSIHGKIFHRLPPIFGNPSEDERRMREAKQFWTALRFAHQSFGSRQSLTEQNFIVNSLRYPVMHVPALDGTVYANTSSWPCVNTPVLNTARGAEYGVPKSGTICLTSENETSVEKLCKSTLSPNNLKKEQQEWLLETEWAQRAFLESYILAVMDNLEVFSCVNILNIARISSGLLGMLTNKRFWDALPNVSEVTVRVSADWRSVQKDAAGYVETPQQQSSNAVNTLHRVGTTQLSQRSSIKSLHLGYTDGGEHAQGSFARNMHVLPAPIIDLEQCLSARPTSILVFPHVQHLTLSNCWTTPVAIERFIHHHAQCALKELTLDSFSLTAGPHGALPAVPALVALPLVPVAQINNPQPNQGYHTAAPGQAQPILPDLAAHTQAQSAASVPVGGPAPQNPVPAAIQQQHQPHILQAPQFQPAVAAPQGNGHLHWSEGHRPGCWPMLLDSVSPGRRLNSNPSGTNGESRADAPVSNLCTLQLKSVGYVKLPSPNFDQHALESIETSPNVSPWFRARHKSLAPVMMTSGDRYSGMIMQWIPRRELDALRYAWGFTEGWKDKDAAEAVRFDGLLAGGSARISGIIEKELEHP